MILDHLSLIGTAFAQDVAPAAGVAPTSAGGAFMQFLPLLLIFVVFYFILIRPQQKKFNEHKTMLNALRRGDKVVTGGGIIGSIAKLEGDDHLVIEIAEGVKVKVLRNTVQSLVAKPEPANANSSEKGEAGKAS
ncbi:MAG: preprotein translocase subunit YajC [Alphaproteobacteria bacterium]|nr:preprotein translocase subunit YajC [Alphaproteobacteria bacterium]